MPRAPIHNHPFTRPVGHRAETPYERGYCRVCKCSERTSCLVDGRPCSWSDASETLCTSPKCLDKAMIPLAERPATRRFANDVILADDEA